MGMSAKAKRAYRPTAIIAGMIIACSTFSRVQGLCRGVTTLKVSAKAMLVCEQLELSRSFKEWQGKEIRESRRCFLSRLTRPLSHAFLG